MPIELPVAHVKTGNASANQNTQTGKSRNQRTNDCEFLNEASATNAPVQARDDLCTFPQWLALLGDQR